MPGGVELGDALIDQHPEPSLMFTPEASNLAGSTNANKLVLHPSTFENGFTAESDCWQPPEKEEPPEKEVSFERTPSDLPRGIIHLGDPLSCVEWQPELIRRGDRLTMTFDADPRDKETRKLWGFCAVLDGALNDLRSQLVQEFKLQVGASSADRTPTGKNAKAPVSFMPVDATRLSDRISEKRESMQLKGSKWSEIKSHGNESQCQQNNRGSGLRNGRSGSAVSVERGGIPWNARSGSTLTVAHSSDNPSLTRDGSTLSGKSGSRLTLPGMSHHTDGPISLLSRRSSTMMSTESQADTPLDRWYRICVGIVSPTRRDTFFSGVFTVHNTWLEYLEMLRLDKSNAKKEYKIAMNKVSNSRSGSKQSAIKKSPTSHVSCGFLGSWRPQLCVLHPHSKFRILWVAASCIISLLDAVIIPIYAFVDMGEANVWDAAQYLYLMFWLIDIVLSFFTGRYRDGHLLMKPKIVAETYARSWLLFDLVMLLFDGALLVVNAILQETIFGVLDAAQTWRILRLIRLFRLGKAIIALDTTLNIISYINFDSRIVRKMVSLAMYFHLTACLWNGVGRVGNDGWVSDCKMNPNPALHCYLSALHWSLTQLHGTTIVNKYSTIWEWMFASISLCIGLVLLAMFLRTMLDALPARQGVDRLELRKQYGQFTKHRRLSTKLKRRLLRYLDYQVSRNPQVDLRRTLQQEDTLLKSLPAALSSEIFEELRKPLYGSMPLIGGLEIVSPKVVTQLCAQAISVALVLAGDVVFTTGDMGVYWRVIESGTMLYACGFDIWTDFASSITSALCGEYRIRALQHLASLRRVGTRTTNMSASFDESGCTDSQYMSKLTGGSSQPTTNPSSGTIASTRPKDGKKPGRELSDGARISEMVLWTTWVHSGDLTVLEESVLLEISLDSFCTVIKSRFDTCLMASRYANSYVKHLCSMQGGISDLFECNQFWGEEEEKDGWDAVTDHFIFLSHYKKEAGTEATLMMEALVALLARDHDMGNDSVFLDSENLTNLTTLRDHVKNSRNLLLLLTPGVLKRPWCLVEIATAIEFNVQVVPIDIQRPGMKFAYPDDEFYEMLKGGRLLTTRDYKILDDYDISLEDLSDALQHVFNQIVLPFSPHKSKNIREAELEDIMKRCAMEMAAHASNSKSRVVKSTTFARQATYIV